MPRESLQDKQSRTRKVIEILQKAYPNAHCELNFSNPLELLVATILSAQCTDKRVNIVTAELFKKYRQAEDYAEELIHLNGVGRKTANVVLGNVFNTNVGVVVDTHVGRLSLRLGLTKETNPEKVEQDLMKLVPGEQWTLFSHWLIWHGRRRCSARKPDCGACEIRALCPTGLKTA